MLSEKSHHRTELDGSLRGFASPAARQQTRLISRNTMLLRSVTAIATMFALPSCSSLPQQADRLAGVVPCCASVSQFQFEELKPGTESVASITESSPAFGFDSGMSYFSAYRLPQYENGELALTVYTYWAAAMHEQPQVFCPSVSFYDRNFQPLSTELLMLSYQQGKTKDEGSWRSRTSVPVKAYFAVLHTESRRIGNTLAVSTGVTAPPLLFIGPAFAYYQRGGPGQAKYQCGHIGEFVLSVSPH